MLIWQTGCRLMGIGTDAGAIHMTHKGVTTGVISIPSRYPHMPIEVVDLEDMENSYRLLYQFVCSLHELKGSSLFGMGKDKIIVGLTWSLCGHDYEAKPLINKENWLSHNRLSCPPLHVKPPKLLLLPT